jgi:hypothetical protein
VWQRLAGDVAEGLKHPEAHLRVQREFVSEIEQLRHSCATLFLAQHSGLRKAACGALSDHRRWVATEDFEQRNDRFIGAKIREAFDGPVPNVDIFIMN